MDFLGAMGVLLRRWYVALPAILVALALSVLTFVSIPTKYESTGALVLTSPALGGTFIENTKPEDVRRINPLLAFDGSLTTTARILTQIVRDPANAEQLGIGPDSTDEFEVNNGAVDLAGPFIVVVATSQDAERSRELATNLLDYVVDELKTRQEVLDAPPSTFITSQVLVRPTPPEAQIGGKTRFAGAAFLLTMFLAFAAPFAVESVVTARRRARGDDHDTAAGTPDTDADATTKVPGGSAIRGLLRPRPPAPEPSSTESPTVAVPAVVGASGANGNGNGNGHPRTAPPTGSAGAGTS